jgi:hypothetical protein
MTKDLIASVAVFAAVFMFSPVAQADNTEPGNGMADKLGHGVVNVLSGWMEIPCDIYYGYDSGLERYYPDQPAVSRSKGMFRGLIRGTYQGVGRTIEGAIDVCGFWAANPLNNEGIGFNFDSEYAWERGQDPDYTDPTCDIRMHSKLQRGAMNLCLGLAEIPSQIRTGVREPDPLMGFVRAIWFGASL